MSLVHAIARRQDLLRRYAGADCVHAGLEGLDARLPEAAYLGTRLAEAEAAPQLEPVAGRPAPLQVDDHDVGGGDRLVPAPTEVACRGSPDERDPVHAAQLATESLRLGQHVPLQRPGAELGLECSEDPA